MNGSLMKLVIQQELINMTHKQYLRRVNTIEFGIQGVDKEEALAALERERMEDLDNHLDMDFVEAMDLGEFDEELEEEYGHLF